MREMKVYVTEEQFEQLRETKRKKGTSMSETVRRALEAWYEGD